MPLTLATWNINSVRLRMPLVQQFSERFLPDILCLQETKCQDGQFPLSDLKAMGYGHIAISGQKGYHGVAILSRLKLKETDKRGFCGKEDARHIAVTLDEGDAAGLRIHNFYIPAGGDEPDPAINEKFAHKLSFLDEMEHWPDLCQSPSCRTILVGDLNIAPLEHDVWSSKQLKDVVSHTPIERQRLTEVRERGNWVDVMRAHVPADQKLYTWWSYRSSDWQAANKGRRLDHIWASPTVAPLISGIEVVKEARGWERPSDHVPVIARFF